MFDLKILLFVTLLVLAGQEAFACSCARNDSPCHAAGGSQAVFVGKVVGSKTQVEYPDYNPQTGKRLATTTTYDVGEIYFEVEEAFVGVKKGMRVTLNSSVNEAACGYLFKRGETYLRYADGTKEYLSVNLCSRTRPLDEASEDLPILRDSARKNSGAKLDGTIAEENVLSGWYAQSGQPLAEMKITLQSLLERELVFKAETDAAGKYEIKGIPAGKYTVTLPLAEHAQFTEYSVLHIESNGFGCLTQYAVIENKNSITGKIIKETGERVEIIDKTGEPMEDAYIELIPADSDFNAGRAKKIPSEVADVDEKGNFTFAHIPAGRYLLAVNYTYFPKDKESAYPTAFYPNGTTPSQAVPIVIGHAEKIKDIVFQLPAKVKQREIRGSVVWEDGEPAQIFVTLYDVELGDDAECCDLTSDNGEFTFKGYEGRKYKLIVSNRPMEGGGLTEVKTESAIFTLDKQTKPFRLTVKKPKELLESENE